jgi:L-cysteine S-thiosulfotransferase
LRRWIVLLVTLTLVATPPAMAQAALQPYVIEGDAIAASLTGADGDPARGREIVTNRLVGLCVLCHSGPFPEAPQQGTLAPDLKGTGTRWSIGQLRLRMVDSSRVTPDSIMPAYYRIDHLARVAPSFRGKPMLTAAQIEDVVAFLATLKE